MARNENSRQRRQRQNRARRDALAARTGERPKAPSRVAPSTADRVVRAKAATDGDGAKATTAGGRERRPRPPRPGDTPVDIDTLEGNFLSRVTKVPGGMQALMGTALAVVVSVMLLFQKVVLPEGATKGKPTRTLIEAYGARGAIVLAIPIVVALVGLAFSLRPARRRVWIYVAVLLGLLSFMGGGYLLGQIFTAGFFVFAAVKSQRVENPGQSMFSGFGRRRSNDTDEATPADVEDADPA